MKRNRKGKTVSNHAASQNQNRFRKKIIGITTLLIGCICGAYILPNIHAIDNQMRNRKPYLFQEADMNEVLIENASEVIAGADGAAKLPVTGCYIQCAGKALHDLLLYTEQEIVCGQVDVYYILQEGEDYSESKHFRKTITLQEHEGNAYHLNLDLEKERPVGIRIDLTEYNGGMVHLLQVQANSRTISICWWNAEAWIAFALALWLILSGKRRYILADLYTQRKLMVKLAGNDLKARYAGSAFGRFWAYIQPLLTILVMWFVFQTGFRNPPVRRTQFILWFTAGYIPWMYFNDSLIGMTNAICDYSYLVKKISFRISLLPAVRLLSGFLIHLFFLSALMMIAVFYGHNPQLIWLQVFYYSFALSIFLFAVGLLTAALAVLLRDFTQLTVVMLQILFWYTPIVWNIDDLTENMIPVFSVNPIFYIINGYRNTLIDHIWVWEKQMENAYFWSMTAVILVLSTILFHRFKPHFADLL